MLLYLFRKDVHIYRYLYLKFGKNEVISAYEYDVTGGARKFKLQVFNKKILEFLR